MFIDPSALPSYAVKSFDTRILVTPGELISTDNYMRGHGTYHRSDSNDNNDNGGGGGGGIYSSLLGRVDKVNKLISVHPTKYKYIPEVGDVIVGRIMDVMSKKWRVEINSISHGILMLSAVNLPGGMQRRKQESDELQMRMFFKEGDILVAEVQQVTSDGMILLHTRSLRYGKLRNGFLYQLPANLMQRQRNHFISIDGVDIVLGVNGMVFIASELEELRMEDVEKQPDLLYSDKNKSSDVKKRRVMARIRQCLRLLNECCVRVSEKQLRQVYESAKELELSEILFKPEIVKVEVE